MLAVGTAGTVHAADDKVLKNLKGTVTWAVSGAAAQPLALNAQISLGDQDIASTGEASLGSVTLPDSSVVTLGQRTRVQIAHFDNITSGTATVVIYDGKTRFQVNHPNGALANYTFKTPVSTIGVRGTYGDISVDPVDGTRVNNYGSLVPITLDTIYGERFSIASGEKVWVRYQDGLLVGKKTALTKAEIDRFAEFGPPVNEQSLLQGTTP